MSTPTPSAQQPNGGKPMPLTDPKPTGGKPMPLDDPMQPDGGKPMPLDPPTG